MIADNSDRDFKACCKDLLVKIMERNLLPSNVTVVSKVCSKLWEVVQKLRHEMPLIAEGDPVILNGSIDGKGVQLFVYGCLLNNNESKVWACKVEHTTGSKISLLIENKPCFLVSRDSKAYLRDFTWDNEGSVTDFGRCVIESNGQFGKLVPINPNDMVCLRNKPRRLGLEANLSVIDGVDGWIFVDEKGARSALSRYTFKEGSVDIISTNCNASRTDLPVDDWGNFLSSILLFSATTHAEQIAENMHGQICGETGN